MIFRKMSIAAITVFSMINIAGQQKFYPFSYENKDGLSDDKGNEIIAPIYDYWRESDDKKLLIFRPGFDSRNLKTFCFDVTSEQGKKYETFYEDEVTIQKVSHHFVEEINGKKYLLNSETAEKITFKDDVYSLKDLNEQFIIAKYFAKEIPVPKVAPKKVAPVKTKGKLPPPILPPPPITREESGTDYVIYNSTSALKPVLRTKANHYFLLNKQAPENQPDENGNVKMQIITINLNDFDFVLFENKGNYQLYDKDFKLIKKFTSKPSEEHGVNEEAMIKSETFAGTKIDRHRGGYPSVGMASDGKKEEPKFTTERDSGIYYFVDKRNGANRKVLSSPLKIRYHDASLRFEDTKNEKSSYLKFNEETLQFYIPKKYLDQLGVKILN